MNINRALRLSAILQASIGLAALTGTGKLPAILIGIGCISIVVTFLWFSGRSGHEPKVQLPRAFWNVVLLAAVAATAADFMWGSQDFLLASLYVLILLVTHKLSTLQDHADFLHLSVLSFLEFLAAAVLTVELWYGIVFILYLVSTVWTLLLWHLSLESREATHNCGAKQAPDGLPLTVRFFWATNIMAVAALGLTLAIFLAMPRTGFGFFQKAGGTPVRTTGFSDKVDLGGIGAVKQDSRLVMRVQFPDLDGPPAEALYFRGAAFDRYNGRSWTNTFARRRRVIRNDDGIFTAAAERPQAAHTAVIRQQILIEALDTSALFGIPFAEEIRGEFPAVQTDWMDGWSLPVPATARFQYVVRSEAPRIDDEERPAATFHYPEHIKTHFLQLPRLNPQIAELTSSITRHAKTPYEQILSIQQYLMSHYRYSLDVGVEDTLHPLDDFLFTRKTGYCEHYATAMVIMLRTLGIPARLVTGFLPGEWNEFGNYYRVRQQDAHAWVEVFFPRSGWITFDPTPAIGEVIPDRVLGKLGNLIDSARMKWDRFVIQYSFRDQIAAAQAIRERSADMGSWASQIMTSLQSRGDQWKSRLSVAARSTAGAVMGALGLGLLVLIPIGIRIYRNGFRPGQNRKVTPEQAIVVMYGRMLRCLASRGLKKAGGCTPLEFSRRVSSEWGEAGRFVTPLTDLYHRIRYGQDTLLDHEVKQAEELLNGLYAAAAIPLLEDEQ